MWSRDPLRRDLFHASLSRNAIHLTRKDLKWDGSREMSDYSAKGGIRSQHPEWAKKMSHIPRVPEEKVVYRDKKIPRAKKQPIWRPKNENLSWMKDPVRKLSRPGHLMMAFCAGTRSTAKAFMLLDKRRKCVGCGVRYELLNAAEAEDCYRLPFRRWIGSGKSVPARK